MEKVNQKRFYLLVLIFLSVFFLFYTALTHSCVRASEEDEERGGGTIVAAIQEYTIPAEDPPCDNCGRKFEIVTIRLTFPQFGGCYVQIGDDKKNKIRLKEDDLPLVFSELGYREAYSGIPIEVVSLDDGRGFISTDPPVQEILDKLELIE